MSHLKHSNIMQNTYWFCAVMADIALVMYVLALSSNINFAGQAEQGDSDACSQDSGTSSQGDSDSDKLSQS